MEFINPNVIINFFELFNDDKRGWSTPQAADTGIIEAITVQAYLLAISGGSVERRDIWTLLILQKWDPGGTAKTDG